MPNWLNNAVFYEIYPQSFLDTNGDGIGDFEGIRQKLDYVKSLGCNAIWMNPCFDSPFMDAGYDVRDYYKTAARYGTNADLATLLKAAHDKGIRVILDLVPGHTSDEHEWFAQSGRHARGEFSDRYLWTESVWHKPEGFHCVSGMRERDGCYIVNFFNSQPALNYGFGEVREPWQMDHKDARCKATFDAMLDVMRFWLELGCDGFRVDMADSLVKNDDGKRATSELWQRARAMLDAEYPEAVLVSEWGRPSEAVLQAGFHCDFQLDWGWGEGNGYHRLCRKTDKNGKNVSYFSGEGSIDQFVDEYTAYYEQCRGRGYISLITGNHDTPRLAKDLDEAARRLVFAFLFTMPGVPFLYYGDEIGMRYLQLPSKEGGYGRTGSRTPMQWAAGENLGFSASDLPYLPVDLSAGAHTVEAQEGDETSLLCFVKRVLALRGEHESLQADGEFSVLYKGENGYPFVYRRGELVCGVNPSATAQSAPVGVKSVVFSEGGAREEAGEILLPPKSFGVFSA